MERKMMKRLTIAILCSVSVACAYTPTNFEQPYDMQFSEQSWKSGTGWLHVGVRGEYLQTVRAYSPDEKKVPATQIWGTRESVLATLEGNTPGSSLNLLANKVGAMQDGTRGTFTTTGTFDKWQTTLDFAIPLRMIRLPGLFTLSAHVPYSEASFSNIAWKSLTKSETLQDAWVRSEIASDQDTLATFMKKHGGVDISGSTEHGFGDVAVMLNWQGHFSQYQRRLRDVRVQLRAGVSLPTSSNVNIHKVFDIDFGHDNALGIPLGAGLRLDLGGNVRIGLDVGGMLLLRRTKEWRLKQSWAQTQHLLLNTGLATREYGPEWKFTLYSEFYNDWSGLSITGGYQFIKHTESTLFPQDNSLNALFINMNEDTEVSESHNLIGSITYSPAQLRGWRVRPELSFFAKYPFNGRRMISGTTIGGSASLRF